MKRSVSLNIRGIANMRRRLIRSIVSALSPHFHASRYVHHIDRSRPRFDEGNRRPLMLLVPETALRLPLYCGETITALTEFGIMGDAWGGGALTTDYGCLCLEDLMRLEAWALAEAGRRCAALTSEPKP